MAFRPPPRIKPNVDPDEGPKVDERKEYDRSRRNHLQRIEELQQSGLMRNLEARYGIDPKSALSNVPRGFYENNQGTAAARTHLNKTILSSQIARQRMSDDPEQNRNLVAGQEIMMYRQREDYFKLASNMYEQAVASIDTDALRSGLDRFSFPKSQYDRIGSIIDKIKPTTEHDPKEEKGYRRMFKDKSAEPERFRTFISHIDEDVTFLNQVIDTYANADAPEKSAEREYLINLRDTLIKLENTDPVSALAYHRNEARREKGSVLSKLTPFLRWTGVAAVGGAAGLSLIADMRGKDKTISPGTAILTGLAVLLGNKDALKKKDQRDLEDMEFLASTEFQNLMQTYDIGGELFADYASDIMSRRGNAYKITKLYLQGKTSLNDLLETAAPDPADPKFEDFKRLASNKKDFALFVTMLRESKTKTAKQRITEQIAAGSTEADDGDGRTPETREFVSDFIREGSRFDGFADISPREDDTTTSA